MMKTTFKFISSRIINGRGARPCALTSFLFVLVVLAPGISGCRFVGSLNNPELKAAINEKVDRQIDAAGVVSLKVDEINGVVVVKRSKGAGAITVNAVKIIRSTTPELARKYADEYKIITETKSGVATVRTDCPKHMGSDLARWVNYEIAVPEGIIVSVETVNGNVSIAGASGANVTTVNGAITIDSIPGNVEAHSVNGVITIRGCAAGATIESTNGTIVYSSPAPSAGDIKIKTVNGPISVEVPKSSSLAISVSTVNGGFNTQLPLQNLKHAGKSMSGTLNGGARNLEIENVNSDVTISEYVAAAKT